MFTLIMLISHAIADFLIQSNGIVKKKSNMVLTGYTQHGFGLLITSLPLLLLIKINSIPLIVSRISIIIGIHLVLDAIKEKIQIHLNTNGGPAFRKALLFACDQISHLVLIIIVSNGIVLEFNELNKWLMNVFFEGDGLTNQKLKAIFLIIYIAFSGAYFIPLVLDVIYEKVDNYSTELNKILKADMNPNSNGFIDEVKTGKWIGILERILIVILLLANQLSSVGFIIAIKSLARFKMMENKIFSEYYLLGTLLSVVYTFALYGFFQSI